MANKRNISEIKKSAMKKRVKKNLKKAQNIKINSTPNYSTRLKIESTPICSSSFRFFSIDSSRILFSRVDSNLLDNFYKIFHQQWWELEDFGVDFELWKEVFCFCFDSSNFLDFFYFRLWRFCLLMSHKSLMKKHRRKFFQLSHRMRHRHSKWTQLRLNKICHSMNQRKQSKRVQIQW